MRLTYQEKSLWLTLAALLAVHGVYFALALGSGRAGADVSPRELALFVLAVAALVATQIVGHAALALAGTRPEEDERDRLIGLKGTRNGSYVLATAVFTALCVALATDGNFLFTHTLLAGWVLAQAAEYGTRLVLYRAGA